MVSQVCPDVWFSIPNVLMVVRVKRLQAGAPSSLRWVVPDSGIILYMHPAYERRRYNVASSLIGWMHTQNDRCWLGHVTLATIWGQPCIPRLVSWRLSLSKCKYRPRSAQYADDLLTYKRIRCQWSNPSIGSQWHISFTIVNLFRKWQKWHNFWVLIHLPVHSCFSEHFCMY